jgi:D-glycero-D-manno-heptose 1,7-bisphosphate phosphatase
LTRQSVEEINDFLRSRIGLDDVRVCYHDDADGCDCRKPKPGLLLAAARDLTIDLSRSFVVGDRWRDIEAGRRAGCRTILINHGYAETRPSGMDFETYSLLSAVTWILSSTRR